MNVVSVKCLGKVTDKMTDKIIFTEMSKYTDKNKDVAIENAKKKVYQLINNLLIEKYKIQMNDVKIEYEIQCSNIKNQIMNKPVSLNDIKLKFQFTISGLKKLSYRHAPVPSTALCNPPLQEIISVIPLKNLYVKNDIHNYYLTYIYYKNSYSLNGYGYLTCDFFKSNAVRSVFTVTSITTKLLSQNLFKNNNTNNNNNNTNNTNNNTNNTIHTENLYLYDNNTGTTTPLILSINGDIVTIKTQNK